MTELNLMNVIKESNPTWDVIFTATDSNTLLDDDDEIHYIFFESALKIKQDNSSAIVSWKIPRQLMQKTIRKEFNFYMNSILDTKGNPFNDAKVIVLRNLWSQN